ncbi:MAG: xanthine dehydrogenase family protein molybdopterin-binding subunit [Acidobacteria bacterium]|nr:xanthine dehydrogenase family protein molybdopterin-binding subunit [Acidobacteriota bacterium]
MNKWTRRAFIGAGALAGGGLALGVLGVALAPGRHSVVPDDAEGAGQLNTWILVTPDNIVTVLVPHCEMGQGAQTALAMMAAEEMDVDWSLVRVKEAPALDEYANGYVVRALTGESVPGPIEVGLDYGTYRLARWFGLQATGGSMSVRTTGQYGMRVAGAAAREMLVAAAAEQWNVRAAECQVASSRVSHAASGRSATFGELAQAAARQSVPSRPTPKDPQAYTLRRTARRRFDMRSKVDGSAVYGIDFTLPGMLHAAVAIAPVNGGKLVSVDSAPAESMPGVKRVVRLEEAVAVVADSYWRASRALEALEPVFDDAGHGGVSSATIFEAFDEALAAPPEMPAGAAKVITADYRVPFLAHATMEPMACTARVTPEGAEVWAGTQDPLNARKTAAEALGLEPGQVRFTNLALGGGFGRRLPGSLDFVGMGARIAQAMSPAPVKMIWSRETDMQHGYFRPAAMSRHAGALDASGAPVAVASHYVGGGDRESTFMPYVIPEKKAEGREAPHHVRTGAWRSVLNSQHGFFKESFIDELAHAAGKDPFAFRRDLMGEHPRFRAVLERAAAMASWGRALPKGEGLGIAIAECFGSIVAEVAHAALSPEGVLKVKQVWAAVDCGEVVNTDTAAAQIEGGIIFGLSAALVGAITIDKGRVVESNFHDYQMIYLADTPAIEVQFIPSTAPPGGLGEPGVPPIAPAVANAIFAATGIRVRELPLRRVRLA